MSAAVVKEPGPGTVTPVDESGKVPPQFSALERSPVPSVFAKSTAPAVNKVKAASAIALRCAV